MIDEILERFSIQEVALCRAMCERQPGWFAGSIGEKSLTYRIGRAIENPFNIYSAEQTGSDSAVIYRFTVGMACKVFDESAAKIEAMEPDFEKVSSICEIHAVYDVDYAVSDSNGEEDEFDEKFLEDFAQKNVPYHVWPFFREHLHSTLSKMQIQPITIQMLRVPVSNRPKSKSEE